MSEAGKKIAGLYQFAGSTFMRVRKQAVMGWPIPSISGVPVSKNPTGGSSGIGAASTL